MGSVPKELAESFKQEIIQATYYTFAAIIIDKNTCLTDILDQQGYYNILWGELH